MDGGVVCVAVHEGRWLTQGRAEGKQSLLRGQLACVRGHGLDRQNEQQGRQRAALEDPRLDWEACCVPAVEGYPGCDARMQEADPSLRSCSEPHCCHAPLHPGSVQPVEGLLEVQEEEDSGLLAVLVEVYGLQMG